MVAMARLLDVAPGQRILEIGAGTGYNAAVLARLVGEHGAVTTVDIDAELAALAREHLAVAGFDRVAVITADGWNGNVTNAPYDRIVVTASVADIAPDWIAQLTDGGKIVLPFVLLAGLQAVLGFRKEGTALVSTSVIPGGFMRLRGPAGPQPEVRSVDGFSVQLAEGAECLGAQPQGAGPPRVVPRRGIGRSLDVFDGSTHRGECRERVGLDIIEIDFARRLAPVLLAGSPRAQPGCHQSLALRRVVAIKRAELEQRDIGKSTIGVAPRGRCKTGQE